MDFPIGLLLIVFGAPLVGLLGNALAGSGRRGLGRAVGVGLYLVVLAVAGWLIVRGFRRGLHPAGHSRTGWPSPPCAGAGLPLGWQACRIWDPTSIRRSRAGPGAGR
ncbi:hypothetical protein [Streptomyces bungoensis]|uniref:hypothetical protein n=1 Tax=Streptomyces bungoensis TaxID=285568 RepID=UPI0033EC4461